jgi:DNA-binding cell septation regulator SpoVG
MLRAISLGCFAFGLVGCSIHPLPDDVTHLRTSEIVHHIRCEARTAIKRAIIDYFRKVNLTNFVDLLQQNVVPLEQLDLHLRELPADVRANIVKYERAAITYDFTFDITEQNTIAAEVDFVNLLSHGTFTMPSKGTNDLQRQTVRLFRVNDSFGELIQLPSRRCTDDGSPENLIYPVSGSIGLGEMIETFVDLNEFQRLTGAKDTDTVPTMTDTFNFQTTISGSVAPQVTVTPLNHLFRVSGASLTASALRKDIHKVIVAMSLPPLKQNQPAAAVHGFLGTGSAPAQRPATAIERNNNAIDDAINRSIINRLGSPTLN